MNKEKELDLRNRMRVEMEMKLIKWHNDHDYYDGGCYNCGTLGIVDLWFRNTWQTRWIDASPLPFNGVSNE